MSEVHDYTRRYRPLLGGIKIRCVRGEGNAAKGATGSIGTIVSHKASGMACMLSNFHVLCGDAGGHAVGDVIHQPHEFDPENVVARLLDWNEELDAAIATLTVPGTMTREVLGVGAITGSMAPKVGERVLKAGAGTGVTEGIIDNVIGSLVRISVPPDFPADYEMTKRGDAGALWVTREGRQAVALHRAAEVDGKAEMAVAVDIQAVEAALGIKF